MRSFHNPRGRAARYFSHGLLSAPPPPSNPSQVEEVSETAHTMIAELEKLGIKAKVRRTCSLFQETRAYQQILPPCPRPFSLRPSRRFQKPAFIRTFCLVRNGRREAAKTYTRTHRPGPGPFLNPNPTELNQLSTLLDAPSKLSKASASKRSPNV